MIVGNGQSLFDIAIQETGSAQSIVAILKLNNISLSTPLTVGQELLMPDVVNEDIYQFFKRKNIEPATAIVYAAPTYVLVDYVTINYVV